MSYTLLFRICSMLYGACMVPMSDGVTYTDFTEVDDEAGKVYEYELDLLNYTHNQQQCNV